MKKYILIVFTAILALFAVSCTKTSEGVTDIINFFQMSGPRAMYLGVGEEFIDPGYVELEDGGTVVTTITDMYGEEVEAVSTEEPGFYTITYYTVNKQGVDLTMKRMVYVYDATVTETLGKFVVDPDASFSYSTSNMSFTECVAYFQAIPEGSTTPKYQAYYAYSDPAGIEVVFEQVVGNIYTCTDLLGGWYRCVQGRGYYYAATLDPYYLNYWDMTGYVTLNADMTLTHMSSYIECWGDGLDGIFNSSYDPESKRLVYDWLYGGSVASHIEMVQQ